MIKAWSEDAWADYVWWQTQDKRTLRRINQLVRDIEREPFDGIGKPEPLTGELSGLWSRRIDQANRLIYSVEGDTIKFYSARSHYGDH